MVPVVGSLIVAPRAEKERLMLRQGLCSLVVQFAGLAKTFSDETNWVMSHFLGALDKACQLAEEVEVAKMQLQATTSKAKTVERYEHAKVEAVAKSSDKAFASHLGQLQHMCLKYDGTRLVPALLFSSFWFSLSLISAAVEMELAKVKESSLRAGEAKQEQGAVVARTAG